MQLREAVVVEKRALTPSVRHVVFRYEQPDIFTFVPGQFIQFVLDAKTLRMYSLASTPRDLPLLELCVDVGPGGRGSQFIEQLVVGQRVSFRGPYGVFTLPTKVTRPLEFVATGAGIAPIRSMIHSYLEGATQPLCPVTLTFGNREFGHVLYHGEWLRLKERNPQFTYLPTLSQPDDSWEGLSGRVTEALKARAGELSGRVFFLCGSPAMVDDTRKVLASLGILDADVHFEKYY